MINRHAISFLLLLFMLSGCAVSNKKYNPDKKFPKELLQSDFVLMRNILEKKHPALYWYTSKDSMDACFNRAFNNITDSMTELQFAWNIIAPVTHQIRCGHTSVGMSKGWGKYIKNKRIPSFPLHLKVWGDTMVVMANLNRKDSVIKKGMQITSINGMKNKDLIRHIFNYLPLDGYADNVNYIRISSNFPYYHRNVFGLFGTYRVGYIDSSGIEKKIMLPMFTPEKDSGKIKKSVPKITRTRKEKRKEKKEHRESYRSISFDSSINTATITLNTFSKGGGKHLRRFFRNSFKEIEAKNYSNLILDLRSNGGGDVGMYVLLTKYLRKTPFKVADSAYAVTRSLKPFTKNIRTGFWNNLGLLFFTRKHKDGNYHFGYWEKHMFKPKQEHHFNGQVYVLINGPTFSASTLFCNAVKGQDNITLVGEETGGGWYGNSGIAIPDIILPNTRLKVRLPLFKIVQYKHIDIKGTGVRPDIYIPPTIEAVQYGIDRKMAMVKGMIRLSQKTTD